jgi:hypothetical protein
MKDEAKVVSADPGKGLDPVKAQEARIKVWKRPKQGDPDPDNASKKLTKAKAKALDDARREERRLAWEARR